MPEKAAAARPHRTLDGNQAAGDVAQRGESALQLEPSGTRIPMASYLAGEDRFNQLPSELDLLAGARHRPETAKRLFEQAQRDADTRCNLYEHLARRGGEAAAAGPRKSSTS